MSRRLALPLGLAAMLACAPAGAAAQAPATATTPTPAAPAAQPKPGRASLRVEGGLATRQLRYAFRGQTVVVSGRVRPFVSGQRMLVEVLRDGRVVSRQSVRIGRSRDRGAYSARVRLKRRGLVRIRARHAATSKQVAFRATGRRVRVVVWRARSGARGTKVLLLQRALASLHYAVPVTGYYNAGTARAVLAFRKVNRMARNGYAGPGVYSLLFRHRGSFRLRYPGAGRHVEFDWSRQVLALASGGRPWRIYHASSGKPSTPTVFGTFRFYRRTPGTNSHGMVHSIYFIRGYAVHGYPSVPPYAASHGCIRVPIPNAWQIYTHVSLGERIFVYR